MTIQLLLNGSGVEQPPENYYLTEPSTEKPFSIDGTGFCLVNSDRLITHRKDYYDMRSLLKQLSLFFK